MGTTMRMLGAAILAIAGVVAMGQAAEGAEAWECRGTLRDCPGMAEACAQVRGTIRGRNVSADGVAARWVCVTPQKAAGTAPDKDQRGPDRRRPPGE